MELVRLGQYEILVGGLASIKDSCKKEFASRYALNYQDVDGAFIIHDACIVDVPSVTQKIIYRGDRTSAYEGHEVLVLLGQYTQSGLVMNWLPACYVEGLFIGEHVRPTNIKRRSRSW